MCVSPHSQMNMHNTFAAPWIYINLTSFQLHFLKEEQQIKNWICPCKNNVQSIFTFTTSWAHFTDNHTVLRNLRFIDMASCCCQGVVWVSNQKGAELSEGSTVVYTSSGLFFTVYYSNCRDYFSFFKPKKAQHWNWAFPCQKRLYIGIYLKSPIKAGYLISNRV